MSRGKNIYKRGNIWWIRYSGVDGKIRFESSKSSYYDAAKLLLVDRQKEVKDGKNPKPSKIGKFSFDELADKYISWGQNRQKGFKTKMDHIKLMRPVFGNCPIGKFNMLFVEEWQSSLLHNNKPATANLKLSTLKHMFTKAYDWEMIGEDTLRSVRKVKKIPANNKRLRFLSKEECHALISACDPHLRPIVITALNTGMRKEEVLSLEWEINVDLKHGFILLEETKNNERREIPINAFLRETLRNIPMFANSSYVFVNREGKRYMNVKKSFRSALEKAGIKNFRFHDLRHTFASHLVMAGVDIITVKELLGHKSLAMTLRYAHLAPSHKVKAVEMLEQALMLTPTIQKTIQSNEKESAHVS